MEQFLSLLGQGFMNHLIEFIIFVVAAKWLVPLANAKIDEWQVNSKNKWLVGGAEVAQTMVNALWESTVKGLKKKAADGKLEPHELREELSKVGVRAAEGVRNYFKLGGKKILGTMGGHAEDLVESALVNAKLKAKGIHMPDPLALVPVDFPSSGAPIVNLKETGISS